LREVTSRRDISPGCEEGTQARADGVCRRRREDEGKVQEYMIVRS
jgi:hypothetical protein